MASAQPNPSSSAVLLGGLISHLLAAPLLPEQPLPPLPLQFGSHLCKLSAFPVLIFPESVSVEGVAGHGWELEGAADLFVGHSFLTLLLTISPSFVYCNWGILLTPLWLFTLFVNFWRKEGFKIGLLLAGMTQWLSVDL